MSHPSFQKLIARLPEGEREIEIARQGELYLARLGKEESAISWHSLEPGRVLLIADGKPLEARIARATNGTLRVEWRGRQFLVGVEDDLARRARLAHARHPGPVALRSPMPGTVIKVLVEEGQTVSGEQPVLIVEAMKMQNELAAPVGGTVVNLAARSGQAVEADEVLLEIRP
jgi:biotin carboxyl carrier protein